MSHSQLFQFVKHQLSYLSLPVFTHPDTELYTQFTKHIHEIQTTMTFQITEAVLINQEYPKVSVPYSVYLYQSCKHLLPEIEEPLDVTQLEMSQYFMEKHFTKILQKSKQMVHSDANLSKIIEFVETYSDFYVYFVPINVQQQLETVHVYSSQVTAQYQDWNITMDMYNLTGSLNPIFVKDLLLRVMSFGVFGNVCKQMRFKIFLSTLPKQRITVSTQCWTSLNINTGCTYRHECGVITIWRQEELCKTLFHEMIHSFGWDFQLDHTNQISKQIKKIFHFEEHGEILLHEAYTETWATLFNIYLCSILFPDTSTISQRIHDEQKFILFQVAKVLHASGISSMESFLNQESSFCQTTNVFSYFIVKSALLWDVEWFVTHFQKGAFHENSITSEQFWNHIYSVLQDRKYQRQLQNIKKHHDFSKETVINKSMRMTITDCFH